jgi:hypothetical protein
VAKAANAHASNLDVSVTYVREGLNDAWVQWLMTKLSFRSPRVHRLAAKISPRRFAEALLSDVSALLALTDDGGVAFFSAEVLAGARTLEVEEVLQPYPQRQAGVPEGGRGRFGAGIPRDEVSHRWGIAKSLRHSHGRQQQAEADRQQPEQVEPPAPSDAYPGRDTDSRRHRSRPRRDVDDVLTDAELRSVGRRSLLWWWSGI